MKIKKPDGTTFTHNEQDMRIYRHECQVMSRHLTQELNKVITELPRIDHIPQIINGIFTSTSYWITLPDHLQYALMLYLLVNAYQYAKSIATQNHVYNDYAVTYQAYKKQYYSWIELIEIAY